MNHIIITFTLGRKKTQTFRFVVGQDPASRLGVFEKQDIDAIGASRWSEVGGLGHVTSGFIVAKALAKIVSDPAAAHPTLLNNISIDLGDLS